MKPLFLCFAVSIVLSVRAQTSERVPRTVFDLSGFHGTIVRHNPDISHLITAHPTGIVIGYNRLRFGEEDWEAAYNYPDTGATFIYQHMNNPTLGEHFGLYAHYNFYFLRRHLQLRIGQGVAYNTNPYDREDNFRNAAYGSHLLSSTLLMLNYQRERVFDRLGVRAGMTLVHYSNANFKAPNASTNTVAFNLGMTYDLGAERRPEYIVPALGEPLREPLRLNVVLRTGANEGDVVGSGQFGFVTPTVYLDKRLGRKSAIQFGGDLFLSGFLRELIRFQANSFPEKGVAADTDWKRAGLFVGHELFIGKLSVISQLGYYVYYPFDFEGRVYNRMGVKRYFGDRWFGTISLHSHAAAAEAVEFGVGIRM